MGARFEALIEGVLIATLDLRTGTLPSLIRDPGRLFIFEILPSRVGLI